MHLLAFGINHHTAPVAIREKAAFAPDRLTDALHEVTARGGAGDRKRPNLTESASCASPPLSTDSPPPGRAR